MKRNVAKCCPRGHVYLPSERLGPKSRGCPTCRRAKERRWLALSQKGCPKERCRRKTRYAVKSGALAVAPCEVCGTENVEAHHDDYSNPMQVRWLCRKHHRDLHVARGDVEEKHPKSAFTSQWRQKARVVPE